jgi:hypothetical protein
LRDDIFHVVKKVSWLVYSGLLLLVLGWVMFCGWCLYPIRGWVHLRASVFKESGRNGKVDFVDSKFTWELFWVMYS